MSWPVINRSYAEAALSDDNPRDWPKIYHRARTHVGAAKPTWPRATDAHPRARRKLFDSVRAVWFQSRDDVLQDYRDTESSFAGHEPQRFVANYRKAGGEIALEHVDGRWGAPRRPLA
jgi:hypothetical protein